MTATHASELQEEKSKTETEELTVDSEGLKDDLTEDSKFIPTPASPVVTSLESMGYRTCAYTNGVVLGVRTEGIKGTRGVHMDTVFVIDWDKKMFSGTQLGIMSNILGSLGRDTEEILEDVGLAQNYTVSSKRTLKGNVAVNRLSPRENVPGSLIHQTRTVYVVYREERPTIDLTWLVDNARIVPWDQFHLCCNSDRRSHRGAIESRVDKKKWDLLQKGIAYGWTSIILLSFTVVGVLGLVSALISGTSWILPVVASFAGIVVSLISAYVSRRSITEFQNIIDDEESKVLRIGDGDRLRTSMQNNQHLLSLLQDLSYFISPLMTMVGQSIKIGDLDTAVESACLVLDELVKKSPEKASNESIGDEGLSKFLGLFETLDPGYQEMELSLSYVGLSNHAKEPLKHEDVTRHSSVLLNALQRIGAIEPVARDKIENMMNDDALKRSKVKMDTTLSDKDAEEEVWQEIEKLRQENIAKELAKTKGEDTEDPQENPVTEETSDVSKVVDEDEVGTTSSGLDDDDDSALMSALDNSDIATEVVTIEAYTASESDEEVDAPISDRDESEAKDTIPEMIDETQLLLGDEGSEDVPLEMSVNGEEVVRKMRASKNKPSRKRGGS